jgi:hypothetical protein
MPQCPSKQVRIPYKGCEKKSKVGTISELTKSAVDRVEAGEDDMPSLKNLFLGFLAGVIATVTIHEIIKYYLHQQGYIPLEAWTMDPVAVTGLPKIVSDALWGGFWGSIFAFILGNVPTGSMTLKGALLGMLGPAIIGVLTVIPLVKGAPLFFDGEPVLIGSVLLILAGFGAMTAWLYGFFTSGCRLP